MNEVTDTVDNLKRKQETFHTYMKTLWQRKRDLFSLFRKRLEQEKVSEIKLRLTQNNQVHDQLPSNH